MHQQQLKEATTDSGKLTFPQENQETHFSLLKRRNKSTKKLL